jgi:hypothetical protein
MKNERSIFIISYHADKKNKRLDIAVTMIAVGFGAFSVTAE